MSVADHEKIKAEHPYRDVKWCVHVYGPDDVLAANDFKEAAERAHEINKLMSGPEIQNKMDGFYPRVWANVELWRDAMGHDNDDGHQENRDRHNWEW